MLTACNRTLPEQQDTVPETSSGALSDTPTAQEPPTSVATRLPVVSGCDRERLITLLDLPSPEVAEIACLEEGPRTLVVVAPTLDLSPTLVVATLEEGRVAVRSERSLIALHPDHPLPLIPEDIRVSIQPIDGHRLRVGIGLGNGEDERTVAELAWIVEVDADGRWTELGAILGDRLSNSFGECILRRTAQIQLSDDGIEARYTYDRSFTAIDLGRGSESVAERRRRCRFLGPRPRNNRCELRHRQLPALTGPASERDFPDIWFIELPRRFQGEELEVAGVVAAAWAARWTEPLAEYLTHFTETAQIAELRGRGRNKRLRIRPVAAEARALRRALNETNTGGESEGDLRVDGAGLRWANITIEGDHATVRAGLSIAAFSGEEGTYHDGVFELRRTDGRWRISRIRLWLRFYGYYDDQHIYNPRYWRMIE